MYALLSLLKNSYGWQKQKKVLRVGLFKKKTVAKTYDKENKKPVIKVSRLPVLRTSIQVRSKRLC